MIWRGEGGGGSGCHPELENGNSSRTRYSLDYERMKSRGDKREKQELKN